MDQVARSRALYAIGNSHKLCLPSAQSSRLTEGIDLLANRGPAPVHVDSISWSESGIHDVTVRVFKRRDTDRFGALGEWLGSPPKDLAERGPSYVSAWRRSVPLDGADLPLADDNRHYLNLIIGWAGTAGHGGPLRIDYTDADGAHGTVETNVVVTVKPQC